MLSRGNRRRSDQVGHEVDAEIAAAIGQRPENLVGLVARMGIHRSAARVTDQYGLGRRGDGVRGGAISAVAEIDSDADRIHLFHSSNALGAQAGIAGFQAAVAENAARIVSELHNAHTEVPEHSNTAGILLQKRGVLKPGYDTDAIRPLRHSNLRLASDDRERFRVPIHESVQPSEPADRPLKIPLRHGAIDGRNARAANRLHQLGAGHRFRAHKRTAKRVDNNGASVE